MTVRRSLRALLAEGGCIAAPGACDAFTARIIERAGFSAIYLGGNAIGLSLAKGQPFVTLTETVACTANVVRAVDAAVVVDAGAGFGEPAHVLGAVRELEAAGASALHIDDQPYPKQPAYHRGRGGLAAIDTAAARIAAARSARRNPDTMLIARTDAMRVARSTEEVIARGRAFAEAGAEALLTLDLAPEQASPVKAALPDLPLIWIGGVTAPIPAFDCIAAAGFAMALYPFNTVAAIASAVSDLWQGLRASGEIAQSPDLLTRMRGETLDIVDMTSAWRIEDASR